MKKILFSILAIGAFSVASAQVDTQNGDDQDKIQQEPVRDPQKTVERTAAKTEVNAQNNKAVRAGEAKLEKEVEKSTGKDNKNPATTNSATIKQPQTIDPPTTKK